MYALGLGHQNQGFTRMTIAMSSFTVAISGLNISVNNPCQKCLADFRGLSNESGSVVNNEQDVAARLNNGKLPMGSSHPRATVCGHSLGSLKS
jgi:hypothetical protein